MTDAPSELEAFVAAFGEWVEACWFDERSETGPRLDAVLGFPSSVVLVGSLSLLARLAEKVGAPPDEVAGALAEHLIVAGPDPDRHALIRDVVVAAGSPPADRGVRLGRHHPEAVARTALECGSYLAQALAERDGVVPSSILEDL